jgi:5'(3')-deoxyribonucleotidase
LPSAVEEGPWRFGVVPPSRSSRPSLVIGVDIDGVLGDQIAGVIPRIAATHGVRLTFEMIDDYRFTLGPVDIATEIEEAQSSPAYLETMPLFPGAREMLEELRRHGRVVIVTARSPRHEESTRGWLERERLRHDELVFTAEAGKSACGLDVLIDDHVDNLVEFLDNTRGAAVLVRRPWNRKDGALQPYVAADRARIASRLPDVPSLIWPR